MGINDDGMWNGFRFTRKKNLRGEPEGWQVTCYHPDHKGASKCCRSRNTKSLSEELCIRKLKWWCLQAFADGVTSKAVHMDIPDVPDAPADLPTMAELDAVVLTRHQWKLIDPFMKHHAP